MCCAAGAVAINANAFLVLLSLVLWVQLLRGMLLALAVYPDAGCVVNVFSCCSCGCYADVCIVDVCCCCSVFIFNALRAKFLELIKHWGFKFRSISKIC